MPIRRWAGTGHKTVGKVQTGLTMLVKDRSDDRQGRPPDKERLLVFPRLSQAHLEELSRHYDLLYLENAAGLESQGRERLAGIRAVLTTGPVGFTRAMFAACPDVRAVISFGTGVDRVDMEEAARRGACIGSGNGANAGCVAEHAMALLLSLKILPLASTTQTAARSAVLRTFQ